MKKLLQLLFTETFFVARIIVIVLIAGVMVWQFWNINTQDDQIAYLRGQKEMVQKELSKKPIRNKKGSFKELLVKTSNNEVIKIEYVLEGTTVKDGYMHALINGIIYATGDNLDEFVVDEITLNSTTIRNPSTEETKTIRFKGDDYFPVQ